jgi:drug/metabolite transporter (DMT)-like permease
VNALSIGLALLAGFLFAIGSVLQQRGTMQDLGADALRAGFILRLLRRPIWLLGVVADGAGYVAQAAALGVGRLVVVQPLMVSSVVFALPLGVWLTGQRVGRREILGAGAVVAGLTVFMSVSNPSGGRTDAPLSVWAIAAGATGVSALALTLAASRRRPAVRAALIGSAAGILFGFVAGLTKSTVDRFDNGAAAVFGDWHIYALAAASLAGFVLVQASLHTGALAPAITTSMVLETVVGVVIGVTVLEENLHESESGLAVTALALAAIVVGLLALAGAHESGKVHAARAGSEPSGDDRMVAP